MKTEQCNSTVQSPLPHAQPNGLMPASDACCCSADRPRAYHPHTAERSECARRCGESNDVLRHRDHRGYHRDAVRVSMPCPAAYARDSWTTFWVLTVVLTTLTSPLSAPSSASMEAFE